MPCLVAIQTGDACLASFRNTIKQGRLRLPLQVPKSPAAFVREAEYVPTPTGLENQPARDAGKSQGERTETIRRNRKIQINPIRVTFGSESEQVSGHPHQV